MLGGDRLRRSAWCVAMLAFVVFAAVPASAEFPPYGAMADPNNPAIASGVYPDPTRDGIWLNYVFYFDCGIGTWIGVAVAGAENGETPPSSVTGRGREFPLGPPPEAERDATDPNHAFNRSTGEDFVFRDGSWRNSKSGALAKSPKLCPAAADANARPLRKTSTGSGQVLNEKPLFPDAYRPPQGEPATSSPQKPNKLPSRSVYIPAADHGFRTLNPSQGPIRISVPRPGGRLDILH